MSLPRLVLSLLTCWASLSVFIAFVILKNYPTAVFGLFTGMLSGMLSHLHILNWKNRINEWYSPNHLIQISRFGFWAFALGVSIFVYFTVIEIMLKKPVLPIEQSVVLPIIWSFIMLKSGLVLSCYARSYSRQPNSAFLIEEEQAPEEDDPVASSEEA